MTVDQKDLGPLDWRIAIVDKSGRPTPEFQRRWALQRGNNDLLQTVEIGSGPPKGIPVDGEAYVDVSTNPATLYVGDKGKWLITGTLPLSSVHPGPPGLDGEDGQDGPPGPPGLRGAAGSAGSVGPQGPVGFGMDGADGLDGDRGAPGPVGPVGATGPAGAGQRSIVQQQCSSYNAGQTTAGFTTCIMPKAPTQGNLLVAVMQWNHANGTPGAGAGWTLAAFDAVGTNPFNVQAALFYKYAGAGESTSQTPGNAGLTYGSTNIWEIQGVTGVWTADFVNFAFNDAPAGQPVLSFTDGGYTTITGGCMVLAFLGGNNGIGYATPAVMTQAGAGILTADTHIGATGGLSGVSAVAGHYNLVQTIGTVLKGTTSSSNSSSWFYAYVEMTSVGPGVAGPTGPQGPIGVGFDGEEGPEGPPGPAGATGPSGSVGPQGIPGVMGMMGLDGEEGPEGMLIPGPAGPRGLLGLSGPAGLPGADGSDGDDGQPIPGPPGQRGATGLTGPQGLGLDGNDGDDGQSIPGPRGLTGSQGIMGMPGFDGVDGEDFSLMGGAYLPLSGGNLSGPLGVIGGSQTSPGIQFLNTGGNNGFVVSGNDLFVILNGNVSALFAPGELVIEGSGTGITWEAARTDATLSNNSNILFFPAIGKNSAGTSIEWGVFEIQAVTTTAGSELGEIRFASFHGGSTQVDFTMSGGALYDGAGAGGQQVISANGGITGILSSPHSKQAPLTGFSITIANNVNYLILDPAGTLATGTITMPAAPMDGQDVTVSTSKAIISITINGNTGQTMGVVDSGMGNPAGWMKFKYVLANTTWYRVG